MTHVARAGTVVESSVVQQDGVTYALLDGKAGRCLAIQGPQGCARGFPGSWNGLPAGGELTLAAISHANAQELRRVLSFCAPQPLSGKAVTIGLGDRLGLAGPGHIAAIRGWQAWPVLAQQSMRELTLTGRTYAKVVDAATWAVFATGFREPWGADGDHLKTAAHVRDAISQGCTMITADVSEKLHGELEAHSDAELQSAWVHLPEARRAELEDRYLSRSFPMASGGALGFTRRNCGALPLSTGMPLRWQRSCSEQGPIPRAGTVSISSSPSTRPPRRPHPGAPLHGGRGAAEGSPPVLSCPALCRRVSEGNRLCRGCERLRRRTFHPRGNSRGLRLQDLGSFGQ